MKIGVISDIHATMEPLRKAMALLQSYGVEQIVCAGDLVDRGHEGNEVVRFIREQGIPTVQGNHDREAFAIQSALRRWQKRFPDEEPGMMSHYMLKSETVGHLSELPATLHFNWEGRLVCLAHGTPTSNMNYLFPWSEKSEFNAVARAAQAEVIILGHTHTPMQVRVDGVWFLNAGSLHGNRTQSMERTCGVLSLPEVQFTVYDVDSGDTVPIGLITEEHL